MICKKCGTEVSNTTFWCPKCGADLTAEEPPPAQGKKRAPRSKRSRNNEAGGGYDGGGYDGGGYDGGGYDGGGYDGGGYDGGGYDGGGYDGGGYDGGGYDGGGYDGGSYNGRKAGLNPRVLVLALIGILLAAGIAVACILMFPLKMTAAVVDDGSASALGTNTLELTLDSNQPIFSVKYAVNPDNPKDAAYQKADSSGFLFRKTLRLKDLTLEPGQTEIQLRVGTLFGTRYVSAGVFKEIGQAAEPDSSALVSIGKGLSLVSNELILVFDDAASDAEIQALLDNCGGQIVGRNEILGEVQVRFGSRGEAFISDLKSRLEQEPLVRAVYYDLSCQALPAQTPNDPEYDFWDTEKPAGNNWAQEAIYLPEAWDAAGRQTVKIGLIDSPVQLDHEDLQLGEANNTFLPSADFASLSDIQTYFSRNESGHVCSYEPGTDLCCFCTGKDHGTHVAGLIAAQSNNGLGVAGADWNCTLYTASGWFYSRPTEGQLKATMTYSGLFFDIATLVSGGCRVVSISMAETEASEPNTYESSVAERYENMVQRLEDRGYDFLIVKAAGNNGDDAANYSINRVLTSGSKAREHTVLVSAADPNVVPVRTADDWMSGASHLYTMAAYSNYGPLVDVAAPGTEVYSTLFGDRYGSMSGTSMAAPLFAGVAGLVYSTDASLSYDQVKAICCRTEETYCARGGEIYPLVSAKGAVDCAQQFSGQLPDANTPALGFISGLVQDALSEEAIDEMSVFITNVDTGDKFYSSVRNGTYECFLAPGSYTAEFASNRYSRDVVYGLSVTEDITTYVPLLNMVPDSEEAEGSISGSAINAFNAETIPYATLTVRKGVNNRNGDIVTEITADGNGNYSLDLDSGNYTFTASANGFMTSRTNILVLPGVHRDNQNCSLTPQLREGEMRIVLTWGEFPNDLDSHLVGPGEGERFHIFFAEKQYAHSGVVYDNLDVDDTLSYGPETTTVYRPLSGTYTFYVHNYSFQSALPNTPDARSLALSGAQVVVYLGGMEEPVVFNVPNQDGTLWTVFSVTDGVITPINAMSFHGPANTIGR